MKYYPIRLKPALLATFTCGCCLSSLASAGEPVSPPAVEAGGGGSMFSDFNFCNWLSNKPGMLYKNPGNPYFSELQIYGRFHWNAAYIDGEDVNGDDFNAHYTDARRFRLGLKSSFLNYFSAKAAVNLVDDQRFNGGDITWKYVDFDEAVLTFDALRAFNVSNLDALTLNYGRIKWHGGLEARTSSNDLLTVERSAISNKLYQSARPTGFYVNAVKGKFNMVAGIYSTDASYATGSSANVEGIGGWNDGLMYNLELIYSATDDLRFGWEFIYNAANANQVGSVRDEDSLLQYEWATTLSAEYAIGNGGVNVEGFLGDNGDADNGVTNPTQQGQFWALTVTPYYWIVPAKLQAVVQCMYAGSEEENGMRTNSRYFRATTNGGAVNSGRGDELYTVYAGLNYLVCGDNLKFQLGAEYSNLNTPVGNASAMTYLFGFRTNF